ncbi:methyl sulfide methyltransferase-associated sensor [Geobacter sp. OR-1]|uniref:GAF domain-containing protein n=1 Tax=Geobacter sp. OR-1 TaxID=1266765 RepID=UPI000543FBCC|nr:GAF domain-containing protein [Geobacter sp. OR-1]GAM09285.1 methyl sulfide methyltransferase-associated sensor [Geobacter sp. OR-1]
MTSVSMATQATSHCRNRWQVILLLVMLSLLFAAASGESVAIPGYSVIRVVMDNNYPPYVFKDDHGNLKGITIDQWRLWEKKTGILVELTGVDWEDAKSRMAAGEFDVIDTMFRTPEREQQYAFSKPYARLQVPLFFHKDIAGIRGPDDLNGFLVAAKAGDNVIEVLKKHGVTTIAEYPSYEKLIEAVRDGKVKVFTVDAPPALYYLHKFKLHDQFRSTEPLYTGEFHRAVAKGNPALLTTLENGFAAISPQEYQAIDVRWMGRTLNNAHYVRYVMYLLSGIAAIIGGLIIWLWGLKRAIKSKTRELATSEMRYRTLVDSSIDVIFVLDSAGVFRFVSPAWEKHFGYPVSEVIGREFPPFVHPDDVLPCTGYLQQVLTTGQGATSPPYRVKHANGSWSLFIANGTPYRDSDGAMLYLGIARDISDQKRAEEEIRTSEKLMSTLYNITQYPFTNEGEFLDHALDEVIRITESRIGYIYFYDEQKRQFTLNTWSKGVMKECTVLEQKTVYDLDNTGIWGEAVRQRRPILLNDFQAAHPQKKGLPDGHVPLKRFLTIPLIQDGVITAVVGVGNKETDYSDADVMTLKLFMDSVWMIAERKRAAETLILNSERTLVLLKLNQMTEASLKELTDFALEEAVRLTKSALGYLAFMSEDESILTMHSWSRTAMAECKIIDKPIVYPIENTGLWGEAVRQRRPIITNDYPAPSPYKKGHPDGHVPISRHMNIPVFVGSRIVLVAGVGNKTEPYDNTDVQQLTLLMEGMWRLLERKRSEAERLNMEKQLLHTQKLESLGVLAGGIAHDFNNILTTIIGNAELALMRLNPESPVLENLQRIENAAARAADLARQMLAYSGKGKFVIEYIDLNRLVEEMGHMLEVSISKKAILRYHLTLPLPSVEADATQIRQIIMNLVINASEAIGDKSGVIAITTGCLNCNEEYLKEAWMPERIPEGNYVFLEVADTGCGMDKGTLGKIFDPFFTTKFTGRGLGMAAVLGIIRGHKGTIRVQSEPDKGSSFKVLFPICTQPAEQCHNEANDGLWQGSGTALLVDDEETVRDIGSEMLKELGFEVLTANDGREAITVFKTRRDIGVVVLDLTMPHMDGEHCLLELQQLDPNVKVIISSGYNEHEINQRFAGKGMAGFIQKPYKLSELRDTLNSAL